MKLFLVKLGKAWNVIKRDGIISGGKRVVSGALAMFRKVGSGDILFITGGVGDSARYRTDYVAEELSLNGFQCSTTIQDNPFLLKYADRFKIFIFHRTILTPAIEKLIEEIKQQKKEIIFEADDLVYDSKFLKDIDYLKNINKLEKKFYEKGVGEEIINDPYVKTCTTTTTFLAEKLKEKGKQVFVVPNKLSKEDVKWADEILLQKNSNPSASPLIPRGESKKEVRLGYFSGTISHNKDFATIIDPLKNILDKHRNVRLVLGGRLDIRSDFEQQYKDRIELPPFVSRKKHFENISKVDINLIPLELNNPFCEAKSELKWFEAGILGVPSVAVANQTFSEAITDGVDGFLAVDEEGWVEKLGQLIIDEKLRRAIGKAAKKTTLEKYTTQNAKNSRYYNYLREKIKQA